VRRGSLAGVILLFIAAIIVAAPWMSMPKLDRYIISSIILSILIGVGGFIGGFGALKDKGKLSLIGGGICFGAVIFYRLFIQYLAAWRGVDIWLVIGGAFMLMDQLVFDRVKDVQFLSSKKRDEQQPKDPLEYMIFQLKKLDDELEILWRDPTQTETLKNKLSEAKHIRSELLHKSETHPKLIPRLREEVYKIEPIQILLDTFLRQGEAALNPTVQGGNIEYDLAAKVLNVSPHYVLEHLERLAELDILIKTFDDKILDCQKCNYYSETITHYKCTKCASRDIEMIKLLEHLACGIVHEKSRYQKGNDYICPKCKIDVNLDALKTVGVTFKCNACNETFSEPLEHVYCTNCKREFSLKEVEFINAYDYTLNPKLKEEIIKALYISTLTTTLKEEHFEIETPGILKGKAQLALNFTIVAKKASITIALELLHSEKGVSLSDILPSVAKFDDVEYVKPILIAVPTLIGEAGEFLSSRKISYIAEKELEQMKIQLKALLKTFRSK
jgi:hypothetical protein